MSTEWIQGRGRGNSLENVKRVSIQNLSPGNINQKSMMAEKIEAEDGDGDWIKLEGPREMLRTKSETNGTGFKARERSTISSAKEGTRGWS